jgi:Na+/H+ antiporter NhaD/arsenite permease-like protein
MDSLHWIIVALFSLGYLAIIFEFAIKINKTAIGLFLAAILWAFDFVSNPHEMAQNGENLGHHLSEVSQILFFLLGAMTLVELIDSHKGFETVVEYLHTHSKRRMLWLISIISFFLSAVLDNLTTTILMITLVKKLIPSFKDRVYITIMIVVAANAGGAWTPIGDVTTTMLWIGGQLSSLVVMKEIFLPSFISMLIPLGWYSYCVKGEKLPKLSGSVKENAEPGAHFVFFMGIGAIVFVPLFKWLTGLPPYMGMLFALALLWIVTDVMHHKYEQRKHLRVPFILTKIDVSNILFFLGILLSVDALQATGILKDAAMWLSGHIHSLPVIATLIGIISAVIDNVPLVAATMGMYDLVQHPMDSTLWLMIAYAAGTGGSIFLIGSSAGVALMGMEKWNFFTYMKKASLPILVGYLIGMGVYVYIL